MRMQKCSLVGNISSTRESITDDARLIYRESHGKGYFLSRRESIAVALAKESAMQNTANRLGVNIGHKAVSR